ncbi:hypothetical protein JCM6882_005057, partial [Rhodosporidiobolus microsporus]
MGAEAFFRVLKHDRLQKRRTSLLQVMETISKDYLPETLLKLADRATALVTLDFRLDDSPWRKELRREVRRIWEKEWERREAEVQRMGGWDKLDPALKALCQRPPGVVRRPPPLPIPIPVDPALDPLSQPAPAPTSQQTDTQRGTCSCPSFLLSRFLICKHIVLDSSFARIG